MQKKFTKILVLIIASCALLAVLYPGLVSAAPNSQADCPPGTTFLRGERTPDVGTVDPHQPLPNPENSCVQSAPPPAQGSGSGIERIKTKTDCNKGIDASNCKIAERLQDFTNALSAIVGIVAVIMIAYWGLQYTIARDNPQATATARLRLFQTVVALVAYIFMYAFLQYIVPGGVF